MRAFLTAVTSLAALSLCPARAHATLEHDSGEFQINTYTTYAQYGAEIAALEPSGFVVVWRSYRQDGSGSGLFGQRIDGAGAKVGTEFRVNAATVGYQDAQAVAGADDGGFVVVWETDPSRSGCPAQILARIYDGDGMPSGGELQVNDNTFPCGVNDADVARVGGGDFVVVWQSLQQPGGNISEISAARLSSSGVKLGSEFRVNTYTTQHQDDPAIAARPNGAFVVVWGGRSSSTNSEVRGQRFSSAGAPVGTEFVVNTYTTNHQLEPRVAMHRSGRFVVVWRSVGQDGAQSGVFGQRFAADGSPDGTEFQVNTYTTYHQGNSGLDVEYATGGSFVVTWNSDYQDDEYYGAVIARRYRPDGSPDDGELVVNSYTTYRQRRSTIAYGEGRFMVVWDSFYQDDSYHAVIGRRLATATTSTTVETTSTTLAPTTTTLGVTTTTMLVTTTTAEPTTTTVGPTTTTLGTTTTTVPDGALCGDANADMEITATDALIALLTAIGSRSCPLCVCDVNSSGGVTASDALSILRAAVGPAELLCATC